MGHDCNAALESQARNIDSFNLELWQSARQVVRVSCAQVMQAMQAMQLRRSAGRAQAPGRVCHVHSPPGSWSRTQNRQSEVHLGGEQTSPEHGATQHKMRCRGMVYSTYTRSVPRQSHSSLSVLLSVAGNWANGSRENPAEDGPTGIAIRAGMKQKNTREGERRLPALVAPVGADAGAEGKKRWTWCWNPASMETKRQCEKTERADADADKNDDVSNGEGRRSLAEEREERPAEEADKEGYLRPLTTT
ncbi:hypothetical protein CMUS01_07700 [Colletotrichum musicola]|uniref:Uncharacterized protein n=1 Tax=Colletotrichum musicola TaxID=2175873 RepID=A0A8H6NFC1_9PEZI|nr:hypothetical protein CMUS01_07700 [Colletotrichum musicola]